ncbi:MAG: sigma-70 family RNA polymerase sigma factor, partial [Clostridia bacterium]|nr:sigma-70 family RNA polymerase sigma factor [Clostridia bacterium]
MTDEELIILSRRGDKAAQEELLNKYSDMVQSVAARFFLHGGENEDLVQEGMVGLYSAINSYVAGGANFSSYAYVCIRNAVLDAIKKSLGAKNAALNDFVPIVEIGGEISPASPEDELIRRENRREFLQKISKILSST